jgi:hypothetical protein
MRAYDVDLILEGVREMSSLCERTRLAHVFWFALSAQALTPTLTQRERETGNLFQRLRFITLD